MLLRFPQTAPALAGLTAALLATVGVASASPASPGEPGRRPPGSVLPPHPGRLCRVGADQLLEPAGNRV
jgi:hypothetical protein